MFSGLSGFSGFTPAVYATLSDIQVLTLLFGERDKDGKVVTEGMIANRYARMTRGPKGEVRPIHTAESLGIPDAAFRLGNRRTGRAIPTNHTMLFWRVWRERGKSTEEIMDLWIKDAAQYGQEPI